MITVSLVSRKEGEIMRFFEGTEDANRGIDHQIAEWICVYREIHKAKKLVKRLLEGDYDITLWLREGDSDVQEISRRQIPHVLNKLEEKHEQHEQHYAYI